MTSSSKVLISPAPIRTPVGGKDRGDPQSLAVPDVGRAGQFVIVVVQVGHIPVNVQPAFLFGGRKVGPLAGVIRIGDARILGEVVEGQEGAVKAPRLPGGVLQLFGFVEKPFEGGAVFHLEAGFLKRAF